jgi:hypothetical protein
MWKREQSQSGRDRGCRGYRVLHNYAEQVQATELFVAVRWQLFGAGGEVGERELLAWALIRVLINSLVTDLRRGAPARRQCRRPFRSDVRRGLWWPRSGSATRVRRRGSTI